MAKRRTTRKVLEHWHIVSFLLALYDIVAVAASFFLALWFRYDCAYSMIETAQRLAILKFAIPYGLICVAVFCALGLYNSIWRFASYSELLRTALATAITAAIHMVIMEGFIISMPPSYYFVGTALQMATVLGVRFSYRFVLLLRGSRSASLEESKATRVMLVGAGNAGQMIMQEIAFMQEAKMRVVCIIDDNPNKWNRRIQGVTVVGGREAIAESVEKYGVQKIFIAIPSATQDDKREILNICKETGCEIKSLPSVYQLVSGQVRVGDMREVAVEDLLGRKPVQVNMDQLWEQIHGKTVLVTGGGGSIGSELCRQVAKREPKLLIILDVYENSAYEIQQELKEQYPDLHMQVLIGSVRDSRRIDSVFATYKPDIVYHAAAHKHVPLMEDSPCESIKNNVIGTYKTAYAAMAHGCERFVLISTDKAVNPTNIMGASKRLCEMVIQSFARAVQTGKTDDLPKLFTHQECADEALASVEPNRELKTQFVAVRFGNVLGSNGSVIPLFKKQIAKGGPVRVTHPDIIRYFMTIPEAVSLVMQAGIYAKGGEIFVLDMGAPVKIDDLARNLIKLSGFKPDVDIPIVYTGLRPGEKLYEEKLMAEEGLQTTPNELIHIGNPIPFDMDAFLVQLRHLMEAAYENSQDMVQIVADIVTTYHPAPNGESKKDATFEELSRQAAGV